MRNAMMAVRPVCNFIARVFCKVDGNDQLAVIGGESEATRLRYERVSRQARSAPRPEATSSILSSVPHPQDVHDLARHDPIHQNIRVQRDKFTPPGNSPRAATSRKFRQAVTGEEQFSHYA